MKKKGIRGAERLPPTTTWPNDVFTNKTGYLHKAELINTRKSVIQ